MNHEDHEDCEGHDNEDDEEIESRLLPRHRMRLASPLTERAERVLSETIGCAIRVHRALGPGFLESIYRKAMLIELDVAGLSYESEHPVRVKYRDVEISGQRVDLIVEGEVVVELKACKE